MKIDLWPLFWIVLILSGSIEHYIDHLSEACPTIEATQKEKP